MKKPQHAEAFSLEFKLNANTPELVRRDPWLVLGQKVGEDPNAVDNAQMLGVETEADFQLPWVEDMNVFNGSAADFFKE